MGHERTSRVFPKVWDFFHLKPALRLLIVLRDDGLYWQGNSRAEPQKGTRIEQAGVM